MKYAFDKTIANRRIAGTDHPVRVVVYGQGRKWTCATLCNGIAEFPDHFPSRRDAIANAQAKVDAAESAAKALISAFDEEA